MIDEMGGWRGAGCGVEEPGHASIDREVLRNYPVYPDKGAGPILRQTLPLTTTYFVYIAKSIA